MSNSYLHMRISKKICVYSGQFLRITPSSILHFYSGKTCHLFKHILGCCLMSSLNIYTENYTLTICIKMKKNCFLPEEVFLPLL